MGFRSDIRKAVLLGGSVLLYIFAATVGAAAQTWVKLAPVGSPPVGATDTNYDAAHNRLIAYFQVNHNVNPSASNQVWVLTNANGLGGTPVWTQLAPTGSPPFSNGAASAVYDPATNRLIVYGGCGGSCSPALANVFALTNANGLGGTPVWTESTTIPSEARDNQSAVYHSTSNSMIAFGGTFAFYGTDQNDTRVLANANGSPSVWNTLLTSGGPPGVRDAHTAIYDEAHNIMTVFGGWDGISGTNVPVYGDVWTLSNANGLGVAVPTWTQLTPTGGVPSPRAYHSAVYDSVRNSMLVFGGATNGVAETPIAGDLWELSNANGLGGAPQWTQLSPTGTAPGPRSHHGAAFDATNQRMIVNGGNDSTRAALNDVWVLILSEPTDLAIFKGTDDEKVQTGRNLTYGIAVVDFGPASASGVVVTDKLPSGTAFVSAEFAAGSCTNINGRLQCSESTPPTPCSFASGTVTCNVGNLAPFTFANPTGAGVRLVVKVTAPAGSKVTNTAEVSASNPDPNPGNNSSSVSTTVTH
jgi:uncharacterized repeat protein (TIGR01451 family)